MIDLCIAYTIVLFTHTHIEIDLEDLYKWVICRLDSRPESDYHIAAIHI